MDRATLARLVDHTLLAPGTTDAEVALLCREAVELGVAAVCVAPSRLPLDGALVELLQGAPAGPVAVCTVVGFPSGAHRGEVKAAEAARAVGDGATEIDVVIDLGLATDSRWAEVQSELVLVRRALPDGVLLKVIIESAALPAAGIVAACGAAERAGADFVKTSTGFHPAGGATVEAVAVMAATVGGRLGIKASGGIRDTATALALVGAGATRLGCSSTRAILDSAVFGPHGAVEGDGLPPLELRE